MAKAYIFLADGFEDIEALAPVDILRRGGVVVQTVSVSGSLAVASSHGVTVQADCLLADLPALLDADALVLPGGMPGSVHLDQCRPLGEMLLAQAARGKIVAAICAAPMVLGHLGLLKGRRATIYPGMEAHLEGAAHGQGMVVEDGNIITACGPAAAMPFGYALLARLAGAEKAREVARGMVWDKLMAR